MCSHKLKKRTRQLGFTLIETLVGISLSLVVLGGVIAVYIPTLQSWSAVTSLADLQDAETTLYDIFGTNIRQAGIIGCGPDGSLTDAIDSAIDRTNIRGWAFPDLSGGTTAPSFLATPFNAYSANISAINVDSVFFDLSTQRTQDANGITIGDVFYTLAPSSFSFLRINQAIDDGAGGGTLTFTNNAATINAGSFYIVNDCNNASVVRANVSTTNGTLVYTNGVTINPESINKVVNEFQPKAYFIGDFNANGDGVLVPTLYERTINGPLNAGAFDTTDSPLIAGVENLRIEYGLAIDALGVRQNHVVNYFTVTAYNTFVADNPSFNVTMDDVFQVKVSVMIRSSQTNSRANSSAMLFPDLNGSPVDCYASGTPDANACPEYVTSAAGRTIPRRVITFNYQLPRQISIISGNSI